MTSHRRTVSVVPASRRRRSAPAVLLPAALLAACTTGTPESGATPTTTAPAAVGISHVHGAGVDPADGSLFLATREGLLQILESLA